MFIEADVLRFELFPQPWNSDGNWDRRGETGCYFRNSYFDRLDCLLVHIQSRFVLACTTSSKISSIRTGLGLGLPARGYFFKALLQLWNLEKAASRCLFISNLIIFLIETTWAELESRSSHDIRLLGRHYRLAHSGSASTISSCKRGKRGDMRWREDVTLLFLDFRN